MAWTSKRTWANSPSTATPITAAALQNLEDGVEETVLAVRGRLDEDTLNGTFAALSLTKTGSEAGVLDWQHAGSAYLTHFTAKAGSTGYLAAYGTDVGDAGGILVSHKNTARGISLATNPGSGQGEVITAYSSAVPLYIALNPGAGPVTIQTSSTAGFSDGVTTAGSATLTSATAAFTGADVGASVFQLTSLGLSDPLGSIPAGATILSVQSATSVTMSANAPTSGSALRFAVGNRVVSNSQTLFRVINSAGADLTKITKAGVSIVGGDPATQALRVTGVAGATSDIFSVLASGAGTAALTVANTGYVGAAFGVQFTNAGATGVASFAAYTYSSAASVWLRRAGGATGNLLEARADGTTPLSRIDKDGYYITAKAAAPADAALAAGEVAIWFDPTNGAAKVKFKAKETGGTVRTGEVALA